VLNSVVCCRKIKTRVRPVDNLLSGAPIRRGRVRPVFRPERSRAFFFCRNSGGGWQTRQHCRPTDRHGRLMDGVGVRRRRAAAATTTVDRGSLFRTDALLRPPTVVPHQLLLRSTGAERLCRRRRHGPSLPKIYRYLCPSNRSTTPRLYLYIYMYIPYARYR